MGGERGLGEGRNFATARRRDRPDAAAPVEGARAVDAPGRIGCGDPTAPRLRPSPLWLYKNRDHDSPLGRGAIENSGF